MEKVKYNPDFPTNTTLVKDIPSAIRQKGTELYEYINELEGFRVSNSLAKINEQVKLTFIAGNAEIPNGIYIKIKDCWYGFNHVDLVSCEGKPTNNLRVTLNNKSYEYKEIGDANVWSLSPNFVPSQIYDFFEVDEEKQKKNQELINIGTDGTGYKMEVSNVTKPYAKLPYIRTSKTSHVRTQTPIKIKNRFSVCGLFSNITRRYDTNKEIIGLKEFSVIMFVRDKFDNIKMGIGYNKDNQLFFLNHAQAIPLKVNFDDHSSYQFAITYLNGTVKVLCDGNVIHKVENYPLDEKQLLFSAGDDYDFGSYPNGACTVGEFAIFDKQITPEENVHMKYHPRCYSFDAKDSYLSLTYDDLLKIKNLAD